MRIFISVVAVLLMGCTATTTTQPPSNQVPSTQVPSTQEPGPQNASNTPDKCSVVGKLPDPACTPGATNPNVTQDTIFKTICTRGWTVTVRPPVGFTEPLKIQQMRLYGDSGPPTGYEEDHLVPLEVGGAPSDPKNLWPEPIEDAKAKDQVENATNKAVCSNKMLLDAARNKISTDWTKLGQELGVY